MCFDRRDFSSKKNKIKTNAFRGIFTHPHLVSNPITIFLPWNANAAVQAQKINYKNAKTVQLVCYIPTHTIVSMRNRQKYVIDCSQISFTKTLRWHVVRECGKEEDFWPIIA